MIQDDDEFEGAPDLDEMQTTTQRTRGKKQPRGGRGIPGRSQDPDLNAGEGPMPALPKAPRKQQAFPKMHTKQPDEGDSPFKGTAPNKAKGGSGPGIAIIISPMGNSAQDHRDSVRGSINKAISTEKRKGPR